MLPGGQGHLAPVWAGTMLPACLMPWGTPVLSCFPVSAFQLYPGAHLSCPQRALLQREAETTSLLKAFWGALLSLVLWQDLRENYLLEKAGVLCFASHCLGLWQNKLTQLYQHCQAASPVVSQHPTPTSSSTEEVWIPSCEGIAHKIWRDSGLLQQQEWSGGSKLPPWWDWQEKPRVVLPYLRISGSFPPWGFACETSSICEPRQVQNVAYFLLAWSVGNMENLLAGGCPLSLFISTCYSMCLFWSSQPYVGYVMNHCGTEDRWCYIRTDVFTSRLHPSPNVAVACELAL